jgi:hypothetical protein
MIIHVSVLDEAYRTLREAVDQNVLVCVARDADSVCAARILTVGEHWPARGGGACVRVRAAGAERLPGRQALLRADHIRYTIKPVAGYDDIAKRNEDLKADDKVRGVPCATSGRAVRPAPRARQHECLNRRGRAVAGIGPGVYEAVARLL